MYGHPRKAAIRAAIGLATFLLASHPVAGQDRAPQIEQLERILEENIIPFWYPDCLDRQNGGYRLNHDLEGIWQGPSGKVLVTQARTLWFFSRLLRSPYGKPAHLEAARHGFEFLRNHLWDTDNGGFFWEVDSLGESAVQPGKHLYGQSFALYGLSEFVRASGDREALKLAWNLFQLLESQAYDREFGGYLESFTRDWSLLEDGQRSLLGTPNGTKSMNTHLHLMEAFAAFYRVTRDVLVRERLLELIRICSSAVVRKNLGACSDQHRRDWTPILDEQRSTVSYGHDVENIWLLMDAAESAGISDGPLLDLYLSLFDYSYRHGFDKAAGGFYYRGPFGARATDLDKSWWVQAEALVGTLRLYERTGSAAYGKAFDQVLEWVVEHQIDWQNGEWFATIASDGKASGAKAGPWKSPYHNGRAVLECLQILKTDPAD